MRQRHVGAGALVLLLGLGALAGCSDDPEPDIADPTSEPTSTSTAAPVSEPPTSEPTSEATAESAQDFIRRWHEVSDAMQVTGETSDYLALAPDCTPCAETAELIASYYKAGGFIRYEGTRVRSIKKLGRAADAQEFEVALDSAPTEYKASASSDLETFPGGQNSIRMRLVRSTDGWAVLDYSVLAS